MEPVWTGQRQTTTLSGGLWPAAFVTVHPPPTQQGPRSQDLVLESVLKVVFQQVHYRDRNFALIKKEGGIMLQLGRFAKAKHTGHETLPIQVILITSSSYANKSRVSSGIYSQWQIALPSSFPIKVQTLIAMINDQGKIKVWGKLKALSTCLNQ